MDGGLREAIRRRWRTWLAAKMAGVGTVHPPNLVRILMRVPLGTTFVASEILEVVGEVGGEVGREVGEGGECHVAYESIVHTIPVGLHICQQFHLFKCLIPTQ